MYNTIKKHVTPQTKRDGKQIVSITNTTFDFTKKEKKIYKVSIRNLLWL